MRACRPPDSTHRSRSHSLSLPPEPDLSSLPRSPIGLLHSMQQAARASCRVAPASSAFRAGGAGSSSRTPGRRLLPRHLSTYHEHERLRNDRAQGHANHHARLHANREAYMTSVGTQRRAGATSDLCIAMCVVVRVLHELLGVCGRPLIFIFFCDVVEKD